ncbi:glycosyl hydrolase family 95 catalytic domain-containing protein [Microbacterium gilvum]
MGRRRSLRFAGAAAGWLEALPLGNGRLGAMAWGGFPAVIDLNEESVWSGGPLRDEAQRPVGAVEARRLLEEARIAVDAGRVDDATALLQRRQSDYGQAFLPVGRLVIVGGDEAAGVERALDLSTGIHRASSGAVSAETFASAPAHVVVHAVTAADVALSFTSPLAETARCEDADGLVVRLRAPLDVAPGHEPARAAAIWPEGPGETVEAVVVVRARLDGDRMLVVVAIESTYAGPTAPLSSADDAERRARDRVDAALAAGFARLRAEHVAAHGALFDRVELDAGPARPGTTHERMAAARAAGSVAASDPDLVATLFDYGRYLLMSSSRPGGLPANLQGLWNADMRPPWSSNYTLNINTQMNYWAAETTALPETVEPLIRFTEALAERGAVTAAHDFGARGWAAHHNSDAWAFTAGVGCGHGDPSWAYWPWAGAWLVRHLVEHERFGSAPEGFVEATLRPLARGAAAFALDLLVERPDGSLGTLPSTSPENLLRTRDGRETALGVSSTMDLALAAEILDTVCALGPDGDPLVEEARAARARIPPVAARATARGVVEWEGDPDTVDPHHRHVSHLYPLFPGDAADDVFAAAAARSLDRRGLDSTGWSLAWKTALWARLGRADRVGALVELFFRDARGVEGREAGGLYANLLAAHPPFQIDGNLGFTAAVAECLLQSHRGIVELLPCLPPGLDDGAVSGLVARPGIVVSLVWRRRVLVEARLRALPGRGGAARVRHGGADHDLVLSSDEDTVLAAAAP